MEPLNLEQWQKVVGQLNNQYGARINTLTTQVAELTVRLSEALEELQQLKQQEAPETDG